MDLHALRKTFGTLLAASGVAPRVAMELMRHSDMKLTINVYTDVTQLPIAQETALLPALSLLAKETQTEAVSLEKETRGDTNRRTNRGLFRSRAVANCRAPAGI